MSTPKAREPGMVAEQAFARGPSMSTRITCAPALAKSRAVASPIPLAPPVMRATFPSNPKTSAINLMIMGDVFAGIRGDLSQQRVLGSIPQADPCGSCTGPNSQPRFSVVQVCDMLPQVDKEFQGLLS